MHTACAAGNSELIEVYKKAGADESAKNNNGNGPLPQLSWCVKKITFPFYLTDEVLFECGGLYIGKVA